jgi:phytoene/squalene synthetase
LLLHLYGVDDAWSLARSDAICTGLQLVNFWQDLGTDLGRGRVYVPRSDSAQHGVPDGQWLALQDSVGSRRTIAGLVDWARGLMLDGAPLAPSVPGRAGWELRMVVQGGLRILDKIEDSGYASLQVRPRIRWYDAAPMAWRAFAMAGAAVPARRRSA